jgi:hypothetical protein
MGSQLPLARRTKLALRPEPAPPTLPRQLDLVLDDVRLWGSAGTPSGSQVTGSPAARGKRRRDTGGRR